MKRVFGVGGCVGLVLSLFAEEAKPVAERYLSLARKAGEEFRATGRISGETQALLDAPMIPPDVYRAQINGR